MQTPSSSIQIAKKQCAIRWHFASNFYSRYCAIFCDQFNSNKIQM